MSDPRGLGRGLEKLLPKRESVLTMLPVDEIKASPFQPRSQIEQEAIESLTESIREHGVLQPVLVRKQGDGFELIAGHRRLAAAALAQIDLVPARVLEASDPEAMTLQLVENLQREDLNPLEEAEGIKALLDAAKITQAEAAALLGKSRPEIANTLRILQAPPFLKEALRQRKITKGHLRGLLSLPLSEQKEALAEIIEKGRTVRFAEEKARQKKKRKAFHRKDAVLQDWEDRLEDLLGVKVRIEKAKKGYRLIFHLFSDEELSGLLDRFS